MIERIQLNWCLDGEVFSPQQIYLLNEWPTHKITIRSEDGPDYLMLRRRPQHITHLYVWAQWYYAKQLRDLDMMCSLACWPRVIHRAFVLENSLRFTQLITDHATEWQFFSPDKDLIRHFIREQQSPKTVYHNRQTISRLIWDKDMPL